MLVKFLSKFLLALFLLTVASVGWAECPMGYRNDYKGDCVEAPVETIKYDNGAVYEGQIKPGTGFDGQGTYTWLSGEKYIGEWKNHKRWNGVHYDKSGNVQGTYAEGVWCSTCRPSSTTASSSSPTGYCYRTDDQYFYKPVSVKCSSSDRNITKQEYDNRRLSSSTTASSSSGKVWCATRHAASYVSERECDLYLGANEGRAFYTKSAATAEHNRLKAGTSTSSLSSNWYCYRLDPELFYYANTGPCSEEDFFITKAEFDARKVISAEVLQAIVSMGTELTSKSAGTELISNVKSPQTPSIVEIAFWESCNDGDGPDECLAYLEKFPEGEFAPLVKIKLKKLGEITDVVPSIPDLNYGRYQALVIGNQDYRYINDLQTSHYDAESVSELLRKDYGFEVTLLQDATRHDTLVALEKYKRTIGLEDNLLIYYAGHGWLDKEVDEGFWLPIDATEDSQVNWIPNADIIRLVSGMQAKHVLVVADSCFSGTLLRGSLNIVLGTPNYLSRIVKQKARVAMTSGANEPVTDVGGGRNSAFAKVFLSLLRENKQVLDGQSMFAKLKRRVMVNTQQTPQYGDMRGHEDGDFLFVRQSVASK